MSDSTTPQTVTVSGQAASPGGPAQQTATTTTLNPAMPQTSTNETLTAPSGAVTVTGAATTSTGQPIAPVAVAAPVASVMTLPDLEEFVQKLRTDLDNLTKQVAAIPAAPDQTGTVPFTALQAQIIEALRPYARM